MLKKLKIKNLPLGKVFSLVPPEAYAVAKTWQQRMLQVEARAAFVRRLDLSGWVSD